MFPLLPSGGDVLAHIFVDSSLEGRRVVSAVLKLRMFFTDLINANEQIYKADPVIFIF